MYLKSLEIQGFKSFPDKTVLTFDEDITAIVGPNGSGKSNISDAIRWVMGEQSSKALRGGKMEDVIFGGTLQRKSTGYAEVSLVLDNSEGIFALSEAEVMVTRRYYRSGESEYYINRRSCRLRDITELFMDTGLGREGYSIIGQGRIDEILSVKSQDRREIFEEAAGISKFRHRKEEAERRLDRTEENLVRINDKIAELELQVEPLREQAEKAKKYLTYRDEMRGLEVSLWMEQLDRLRTGNIKLMADYAQAVRQRDEAAQEQENLYARSEELQDLLRQREQRAEELRELRSGLDGRKADADRRLAVLNNQRQSNNDTINRIKTELDDQRGRESTLTEQIAQAEQRMEEIRVRTSEIRTALARLERDAGALVQKEEELREIVAEIRKEREAESDAASEAKSMLSALAAASQELIDRDTALRTEIGELREQEKSAEERVKQNQKDHTQQTEKHQEVQNRIDAWKLKLNGRKKAVGQLGDTVSHLRVEENTMQSRIKMLSEMEKVFEGYSKAVKQVMGEARRGGLAHIRGPVAGLMSVPDEYTVAIEIALGGAMQNLVVDREEDGKRAIQWLKRRDAGRATFLPLSVIRGNRLQERGLEQEFGFVGIACDMVTYQEEYRNLFSNLLGRVVVAENMDAAIQIANRYRHRFRIVTLDGQVLNPGGSMTGGSVSRSAGILSRANELKRLRTQQQELHSRLKDEERKLEESTREVEKLSYSLRLEETELRQVEDALLKLEAVSQHNQQVLSDLRNRLAHAKKELSLLDRRSVQNEEKITEAKTMIQSTEAKTGELQAKEQARQEAYSRLLEQGRELNEQMHELRTELATLSAESDTLRNAMEQQKQLQTDILGDRESRIEMIQTLQGELTQLDADCLQEQGALEEIRGEQEKLEEKISELSKEKLDMEAQRARLDRESRDKNNELLNMEREVSVLEQKKNAAASEEKVLLDKLWDTYELSHSAAQAVRFPIESIQKVTRRINELKRSINGLGNVNIGAVEEYERVNGRYTYLIEQRDDVTKSKTELLEIIEKITKEMEAIFREEFKKIQAAFSLTFVELFGGGRASLELEDPDDILNCGIEIKVQPPGKALKIISLLSGGEKAFVAIALYFAILKVRPTPFVVMDEIEAALDDSNVVRYARYMRNMTENTQFIVITHRRGTMEEADVLYGVTMQEQGVSRMLTLNLNEVEQELHLTAE